MGFPRIPVFAALLLGLLPCANIRGQFLYNAIDLGTLGGTDTRAHGINYYGQVVGGSNGSAFLYSNGVMTSLGSGFATEINLHGTVLLGNSVYQNGAWSNIPLAGEAINNLGDIVGTVTSPQDLAIYSNGTIDRLDFGAGSATAINDLGAIVGNRTGNSFLHADGVTTSLWYSNATSSYAWDINNAGQIVGSAVLPNPDPFLIPIKTSWTWANGTYTGIALSGAFAINNAGAVVGYVDGGGPQGMEPPAANRMAFLYSNGQLTNLNSVTNLAGTNFSLLNEAWDINDRGQIVGFGRTASNHVHAFLLNPVNLTPVPEPSTYGAIAAAGLLALMSYRLVQRRRGLSAG